ncbi:MAG: hypothetical protein A2Z16_06655 [Chloroflexi bacterium RBG_16_54_18]|nr:MAG: hypothetical protein A2Z16_06655 [Chloroflexi bacterium RBG_16_54_18]
MDTLNRLQSLSCLTQLEAAEDLGSSQLSVKQQDALNVSHAMLPNGKRIHLLKTMLTSACERDCHYCGFRAGRDFRRATLKPDEMAQAFMAIHRAGVVDGMFLSSGMTGGGVKTQDHLLATAEILRRKHAFRGYLHLKLMPGVQKAQVEQAMKFADRVSLNLEGPNTLRLERLAPHKAFMEELLQPLKWMEEIRRTQNPRLGWNGRWPSMSTQFVVGAVGESDLELMSTTEYLHQKLRLGRAYFMAFNPLKGTPFENLPPASPRRELHLYQASFLIRDYGFSIEELPFSPDGSLPEKVDPKTAWAEENLHESPVEINKAAPQELVRIPGIGPKGAQAILKARKMGGISTVEALRKIGVDPTRPARFILLNGRQPDFQLALW